MSANTIYTRLAENRRKNNNNQLIISKLIVYHCIFYLVKYLKKNSIRYFAIENNKRSCILLSLIINIILYSTTAKYIYI